MAIANGPVEAAHDGAPKIGVGLTTGQAMQKLADYGPNRLDGTSRGHVLVQFLRRFANPLTIVLLGAALVSAITGEVSSFAIIVSIVFLSVTLDFVQERRAGKAIEALQQRVALRVQAYRDGRLTEIAAAEVVPQDVIVLAAGDLVPADCDLLQARDLFVNEASLTGESFPVEKHVSSGTAAGQSSVPVNAVCMGSSVVSGTARAVVRHTGRSTQLGAISASLHTEPETAFTIGIRRFGFLIIRLTVLLVLFVILVNLLFHRPVIESFLFALALAVGLTPELLPMIISVTLARGAMRMAEKQVIVKRPSAIHDLGSMDVLCCDKTGTLTEAKIELVRTVGLDGADNPDAFRLARLNAAFETGLKSPLDLAILHHAGGNDDEGYRKIDEVPFDFERRRVSVLVEKGGKRFLIVKGAPEDVLQLSSRYESGTSVPALEETGRAKAASLLAEFGREGFRTLGVAWREVEADREHAGITDETDLIFAGFTLFLDPPKESAKAALAALEALGVGVKVITGDNEHIARHVCEALTMPVSGLLTGADIDRLSDEALPAQVEDASLFCRITPMQKARIIRALQKRGHVVGYLGDGINDAPSINAADAGISVDSAVDVAKGTASLVLLQKDLGVLVDGVKEGRRTFANILKYIVMGTSSNFGNMFSMAGAVLILPFLPMLPIQILLNNLLYDISEIAIPLDGVDEDFIARPHRWNMQFVRNVMLVLGPISSLFDFVTFGLLLIVFHATETLFHTGWFLESLMTQVLVIFIIRTTGNPLRSKPAPLLVTTSLAAIGIALLLIYALPEAWLGFVPLPANLLLTLAAVTGCYLLAIEAVKRAFRRELMPV